jgi:sulfhydrogenase subunit beta (sulfur reductase)
MVNAFLIEAPFLQQLLEVLQNQGYVVWGPTLRQGDLVYDEVHSTGELPVGRRDEEEAGSFRLIKGNDKAYFGCRLGQHSLPSRPTPLAGPPGGGRVAVGGRS